MRGERGGSGAALSASHTATAHGARRWAKGRPRLGPRAAKGGARQGQTERRKRNPHGQPTEMVLRCPLPPPPALRALPRQTLRAVLQPPHPLSVPNAPPPRRLGLVQMFSRALAQATRLAARPSMLSRSAVAPAAPVALASTLQRRLFGGRRGKGFQAPRALCGSVRERRSSVVLPWPLC